MRTVNGVFQDGGEERIQNGAHNVEGIPLFLGIHAAHARLLMIKSSPNPPAEGPGGVPNAGGARMDLHNASKNFSKISRTQTWTKELNMMDAIKTASTGSTGSVWAVEDLPLS